MSPASVDSYKLLTVRVKLDPLLLLIFLFVTTTGPRPSLAAGK